MGLIIRFFQILWWVFMLGALWSMARGLYRLWKAYGGYYTGGERRYGRMPWWRPDRQNDHQPGNSGEGASRGTSSGVSRETVPCAACGIFVEKQSAVKKMVGGREVYYCSEKCSGGAK
ncbi:MAG: hypothetical protein ACM3TT_11935 [Syntrophothermus sp.]